MKKTTIGGVEYGYDELSWPDAADILDAEALENDGEKVRAIGGVIQGAVRTVNGEEFDGKPIGFKAMMDLAKAMVSSDDEDPLEVDPVAAATV